MLYTLLAVFAAVLGLGVTAAAVYTAWYVYQLRRKNSNGQHLDPALLLRWTVFDYAVLLIVLTGLIFLLADLIGVVNDRDLYPYYHYGYLVSGFIFTLLGVLFMLARLFLVLRLAEKGLTAPNQHHKPHQADHSK
ncbi:MAG: hypothetical protein K0R57_6511 [Paenibacillaceae bacterium]|jgi:hypothetical protein|nr:hypothetical protein [Paenibacillaceae bacterium]